MKKSYFSVILSRAGKVEFVPALQVVLSTYKGNVDKKCLN